MGEEKDILVFAEVQGNNIATNSLELLGEATRLKLQLDQNTQVIAALLGENIECFADELFGYGADRVIYCNDSKLAVYRSDTYGDALAKLISEYKPLIVLIGATYLGMELAPTVAAKIKTGLAAHCTELHINKDGLLVQVVPAFGGKVLGDILTPIHRPQMATIKAGITKKNEFSNKKGNPELFTCEINGFGDRIQIVSINKSTSTRKPLNESECIIGGGFGIGGKENWSILEELACKWLNRLHAASVRRRLDRRRAYNDWYQWCGC
jgi:electron transfer flavoprotein alpha subunit